MNELLQEFVRSGDTAMHIDRQQAVIRGVKLLGLASANGHTYLPQALADAASLYEGAKVNVNHPKGSPLAARDYQDRLGAIRNVEMRTGEGLFGDLHFNPRHALAEQLLWDAAHAPQNVGLSHNVEARVSRREGQTVVEAIIRVQSVDLVADPASTRGLYESSEAASEPDPVLVESLRAMTLAQLRTVRADLVEAIAAEARAKLAALESEVDRLRAREALHQRRTLASRVLNEYRLPDPTFGNGAHALVSEQFVAALMAAPDERAMRALAEERAELIDAACTWVREAGANGRPLSREQQRVESRDLVTDGKSFAKAIA